MGQKDLKLVCEREKLKLHRGHGVKKVKKPLDRSYGFLHDSAGKVSASNGRDTGVASLILGSERSPGGENGNPLQYACLESPMDRGPGRLQSNGCKEST